MRYVSTRGLSPAAAFSDILARGLAPDGGLYVPETWPRLGRDAIAGAAFQSYPEAAATILAPFVDASWDRDTLVRIFTEAYADFDHPAIIPLRQIGRSQWLLELFHGPTLAFKDLAMQVVARLFNTQLQRQNRRVTVLGATSGDTGAAAIAACRDLATIETVILFPHGRVSEMQRRQMTCLANGKTHAIAIDGTFDDCQALVKAMFNDDRQRETYALAAVNSINWARIAVQAIYYVLAAAALGAPDRPLAFAIPSGNFGNAFSAYVARQMGIPIHRILIGTNANDALARFFQTGRLGAGMVTPTLSPSMDIQIPSNLERYLFELLGRDGTAVREFLTKTSQDGAILPQAAADAAQSLFAAHRCDDGETLAIIRDLWRRSGILADPHSAVGLAAATHAGLADMPVIAVATAHPAKFADAIDQAIGHRPDTPPRLAALASMPEHVTLLPNDLSALQDYFRKHIETKS